MNKRIFFKVSNRLYLKLNEGCEQASAKWRASKHPKKLTSERASREDNMKKYEVKIPMCLVGTVKAKNEEEAIEIASESFNIDNTLCEWWDIVEPQASEQKG